MLTDTKGNLVHLIEKDEKYNKYQVRLLISTVETFKEKNFVVTSAVLCRMNNMNEIFSLDMTKAVNFYQYKTAEKAVLDASRLISIELAKLICTVNDER